jgi:hypothetical protein
MITLSALRSLTKPLPTSATAASPFRSETFAPTRTARGNEQGNEQGGKHKNKLKLEPKHNNKRKELTRADRLHKSKRRQHVFLDAGPNWIEISFFL